MPTWRRSRGEGPLVLVVSVIGNAERAYLDLLKRALTREISEQRFEMIGFPTGWLPGPLRRAAERQPWKLVRRVDPGRGAGWWPLEGETMVGLPRLDHLERCIETVVVERVPGDLIETGVWRGGVVLFMRAMLDLLGDEGRTVFAADSFAGLPPPDVKRYPEDEGLALWSRKQLAVSLDRVSAAFDRYGVSRRGVRFLEGWFEQTLPRAPIDRLAIARLDGDMYGSTIVALEALYPKLSPGGFLIVDDYHEIAACRKAVDDYRTLNRIHERLERIDDQAVFWRREAGP